MHPTSRAASPFPEPEVFGERQVREFLDPWHPRASVAADDGAQVVVDPVRVLDNVTLALLRLDVDLDAPAPLGPGAVSDEELVVMLAGPERSTALVAHVVNTAVRAMLARYPEDAVRAVGPPDILAAPDEVAVARELVHRRLVTGADLDPGDLVDRLAPFDFAGHVRVLDALARTYLDILLALKLRP